MRLWKCEGSTKVGSEGCLSWNGFYSSRIEDWKVRLYQHEVWRIARDDGRKVKCFVNKIMFPPTVIGHSRHSMYGITAFDLHLRSQCGVRNCVRWTLKLQGRR